MKTPWKRLQIYVGNEWKFKTIEEATKYIKNNSAPDYISIDGILYTMEEFDQSGKQIVYANRRNNLTLEVTTENRYKNGFGDAQLEIYPACSYRNGFIYAD